MAIEDETPEPGRPALERITINLTPAATDALAHAAALTRMSRTDTVNRALQVYDFFMDLSANGGVLLVRHQGEQELERVRIL